MILAGGIDLGGTKIAAQAFGADWQCLAERRIDTPRDYPALVGAVAAQMGWLAAQAGRADLAVGVAAAGLVNPATGLALTANLAASGQPFPADVARAAGRAVVWTNDCRAMALSEAVFGAARGADPAVGLILGTGIGGGVVAGGRLLPGATATGGEFGHFALAAGLLADHGLPVLPCGCGRRGCTETLISGTGLSRLCRHLTGRDLTARAIAEGRQSDTALAAVWEVWAELAAEMVLTLCLTVDPQVVVLGGGLSRAPGLVEDLAQALRRAQLPGFGIPDLRLAQGGDASGARGAAYAAHLEAGGAPHV